LRMAAGRAAGSCPPQAAGQEADRHGTRAPGCRTARSMRADPHVPAPVSHASCRTGPRSPRRKANSPPPCRWNERPPRRGSLGIRAMLPAGTRERSGLRCPACDRCRRATRSTRSADSRTRRTGRADPGAFARPASRTGRATRPGSCSCASLGALRCRHVATLSRLILLAQGSAGATFILAYLPAQPCLHRLIQGGGLIEHTAAINGDVLQRLPEPLVLFL